MTLQNRVLPDGSIVTQPWRGNLMGNRGGKIHNPETRTLIKRRWVSRRWIICVTNFKGRHRKVMGDGYTELFFADEASALASGHRPCFECQRHRANAFARSWENAFGNFSKSRAEEMDHVLHMQRLQEKPVIVPRQAENLPDGAMFKSGDAFFIRSNGTLLRWTPAGIRPATLPDSPLQLLTPPSVIEVLRAGYRPQERTLNLSEPGEC